MSLGRLAVLLAIIAAAAALYFGLSNKMEQESAQKLMLKTLDGKDIVALYYPAEERKGAIVFVHMMPATKESWNDLAVFLKDLGYTGLAIDLRGHGESEGGPKGYVKYEDADHEKSVLDLDVAAKYLLSNGYAAEEISFIGASIGANLALRYIADYQNFKTAILLSAGLNYRGVETLPAIKKLSAGQKVFLVSSEDDGGNSRENREIYEAIPEGVIKNIKVFKQAGHGTDMFAAEPDLTRLIYDFLNS